MDDLQIRLLIDLHKSNFRQGPGGEAETKRMPELAGQDTGQDVVDNVVINIKGYKTKRIPPLM